MREDSEGFLYPETDATKCIDCHLCEKVCPVINRFPRPETFPEDLKDPLSFAAKINDETIRAESSSGGIFTALATQILKEDGVVFGVRWNPDFNSVVFDYTETEEGLSAFRGSKYLQAVVGNAFKDARKFLNAGRKVLFTGTPCHISGLKRFLRKDFENLFTAEVVCHGVPSPKVWRLFLAEQKDRLPNGGEAYRGMEKIQRGSLRSPSSSDESESCEIKNISFRSKAFEGGWKKFSYVLSYIPSQSGGKIQLRFVQEPLGKNVFMRAFLRNICLRPSCYDCPAKGQTSGSDITLGDFWGVQNVSPDLDDNKGTSLVCVNTEKGSRLLQKIERITLVNVSYAQGLRANPALIHNPKTPENRPAFFQKLDQGESLYDFVWKITAYPLAKRIRERLRSFAIEVLKRVGMYRWVVGKIYKNKS